MDSITINSTIETPAKASSPKGNLNVYYHFYHPDDVVSAEHFKDLCEGLAARNWQVTVFTSNRYCRKPGTISPSYETINGVDIKRCWRPGFNQASNLGRLLNSFLINLSWTLKTALYRKPDFFIVGTDPQFSQFLFPVLKLLSPKTKIVHWCFDLYPEAVVANTDNSTLIKLVSLSKPIFKFLYRFVNIMVDIGSCMQQRLNQYNHRATRKTLVPWALVETDEPLEVKAETRREIFGDVSLVLLYSGNLGQAHQYSLFLKLARNLRDKAPNILFAFSSSGNQFNEFKSKVNDADSNIKFLPFAKIEDLQDRLVSADIHLISLKDKWSGIVVPSKFFGSLAAGRPVLFHGPKDSGINRWIEQYDIGASLTQENIDEIAADLIKYAESPELLNLWKENAFNSYNKYFSRKKVIDEWDQLLVEHL